MALTDTKVRSVKPKGKECSPVDSNGMFLFVKPGDSKYWRFHFRFGSRQHLMALGIYLDVSLADAGKKREEVRRLITADVDPRKHERAVEEEQAGEIITFEKAVREWFVANQEQSGDHANHVKKGLEDNISPIIGARNIAELGTRDLLTFTRAVEKSGCLEAAPHFQRHTTAVMCYTVRGKLIDYDPTQGVAGAIVSNNRQHRPALELKRVPELLQKVDDYTGRPLTRQVTELTLLTFIRSGELRFTRWSEVDFEMSMRIVPPERESIPGAKYSQRGPKIRTPRLVPLSKQVLAVLKRIEQFYDEYELISISDHDPYKPTNENTINSVLRAMGYGAEVEIYDHGLHTMACSSLVESESRSKDTVERQMGHIGRNSARTAYIHKAGHLDERELMLQW